MTFPEDDNPVTVLAGPSALAETYRVLRELGVDNATVVCGRRVASLDLLRSLVREAPTGLRISVYDLVEPDPSDTTCERGGEFAREAGAQAIIGIGGGSSMDAAKAIAAEAVQPGWTVAQDHPGEPAQIDFAPLPVLLAPTTAGTASEVTPFSVITYTKTKRKLVLGHPALYARYALLDPLVLQTCSETVRVAAGTDQTRRRALQSIALVAPHLPRVVDDVGDVQAQEQLQLGAMIAGLAFSKSRLGIVHAMALPLSALFGVPHGVANAVLLPFGMEFNAMSDTEGFAAIAAAMGVDTAALDDEQAAATAVDAVRALATRVGAPRRMSEVGVEREAIPRMAEDAMPSAHIACNPRPIQKSDLIELYTMAF
jgi:alcohol dehydrogenase class IV